MAPIAALQPQRAKINAAEFLTALITCETFAQLCVGRITVVHLDNVTAKAWLDSARYPRFPFDRCDQGTNLYMIKTTMKMQTQWVPSEANDLADTCSREPFSRRDSGYMISGVKLLKVRPKRQKVIRLLLIVFNIY